MEKRTKRDKTARPFVEDLGSDVLRNASWYAGKQQVAAIQQQRVDGTGILEHARDDAHLVIESSTKTTENKH
jgi:hypothetical protein